VDGNRQTANNKRRTIRAVLLDAGHTILEGKPSWFDVWAEALGAFDVTMDREALQKAYARASDALSHIPPDQFTAETWRQFLREMVANLEVPGHEDAIADRMHQILAEVRPEYSVYEEVHEVLDTLRGRGLRLGIVSNWEPDLPDVLARAGLDGRFDTVVASAAVRAAKPDPRIFRIALDALGIPASGAIHVGDSYEADVQGARAAGVHPVLLDRDRLYHEVDCDLIRNLRELPLVLERLEQR
jgi:putative hydrolase of the HAD superfamily